MAKVEIGQWMSKVDRQIHNLASRVKSLAVKTGNWDAESAGTPITPNQPLETLLRDEHGQVVVNTLKKYVRPYVFRTTPTTAAPTTDGTVTVSFVPPVESNVTGDCEIFGFAMVARTSDRFRVRMKHTGISRWLSNQPVFGPAVFVDLADMALLNPEVAWLDESIFLEANQELQLEITSSYSGTNTIELVAIGRRFFDFDNIIGLSKQDIIKAFAARSQYVFPYFLTNDEQMTLNTNSSSNATTDTNLTLPRDIAFEAKWCMDARWNGRVFSNDNYHVTLYDGRSGAPVFDNVHRRAVFGASTFHAKKLPDTLYVPPGTITRATITNDDNNAIVVDTVLKGRAIRAVDRSDTQAGLRAQAQAGTPAQARFVVQ